MSPRKRGEPTRGCRGCGDAEAEQMWEMCFVCAPLLAEGAQPMDNPPLDPAAQAGLTDLTGRFDSLDTALAGYADHHLDTARKAATVPVTRET